MIVKDLIKMLKNEDPNAEVMIEQPSHDHWHSMLAAEVSSVETKTIRDSEYHSSNKIVSDDPEKYGVEDEDREVVVIG
jgi:hypothetical protein